MDKLQSLGCRLGALLLVCAPLAAPQSLAGAGWSVPMEHLPCLRAERVDAFFAAWDAADEQRRGEVRELFAELVSPGAPAELLPSFGAIEVGRRVLQGESRDALLGEQPAAVLTVQAMALDLRVRPGLVEAQGTGRAVSLTIDIATLYELRDSLDVDLSLIWRAPDGTEQVARTEPIGASAFRTTGFQMYVRAPQAEPGLWHLVPELSPRIDDPGARPGALLLAPVRGLPVPVPIVSSEPGIAGLVERAAGLGAASGRSPLVALLESGERLAPSPYQLASEWFELPADPQLQSGGVDLGHAPVLLVVEPRDRAGGPSFAGRVGAAWLRAAADSGRQLAVTAPLGAGETARVTPACAAVAERGVTLVVFGDAILGTQLEFLRHGAPAIERLVVVARAWRPTPTMPAVPTLYLTPEATSARVAAAAEHVTVGLLDDSIFLCSQTIPGRIAAWLAEQDAPGPGNSTSEPGAGEQR